MPRISEVGLARRRELNTAYTDHYLIANHICATCGRPTAGRTEFHYDCLRDERGRLLVRRTVRRAAA